MDDSTKIMGEGQGVYALDGKLAAEPEQCPHCSAEIHAGDMFCTQCGYQRGTWGGEVKEPKQEDSMAGAVFILASVDGMKYPLKEGDTLAGRSGAPIQLDDGYVSRQHAKFTVEGGKVTITDLGSSNGTFIDDEQLAINEPHGLVEGSGVRLGQTELTLQAVPEPERVEPEELVDDETLSQEGVKMAEKAAEGDKPAGGEEDSGGGLEPAGSPWRVLRDGETVARLDFGETMLGRKAGRNDIAISDDGYVSGQHCKLVVSADTFEVVDLGSTNGSYADGERCEPSKPYPLNDGSTLRVGQTDLTIQYVADGDEESSAPEAEAAADQQDSGPDVDDTEINPEEKQG